MWYEVLPPIIIMYICLEGPRWLVPKINENKTGSKYLRDLQSEFRRDMLHRDIRITGDRIWRRRLELIPDEP